MEGVELRGSCQCHEHQYSWDAQIYSITLEVQLLLLAPAGISVLINSQSTGYFLMKYLDPIARFFHTNS